MLTRFETDETPITTPDQLAGFLASSACTKPEWRITTAHEKFPFHTATLRPLSYDEPQGMHELLLSLKAFGWRDRMDSGVIASMTRGGASAGPSPAGQLEYIGCALSDLHETASEIDQHLDELREIGGLLNIGFLGLGHYPTTVALDADPVPLPLYQHLRTVLDGKVPGAQPLSTASARVRLNYADETDLRDKLRVATALQPVASALFAASPFHNGKPSGYRSYCRHLWQNANPARCGLPSLMLEPDFSLEKYVNFALDVPMLSIIREGRVINCAGQSFRDFLRGKLPALPGVWPVMGDWIHHLRSLFTDVRLCRLIEMRGADAGTAEMILALPSFWVGLLYDRVALDGALSLVKDWQTQDCLALHAIVPAQGLSATIGGRTLQEIAHDAVKLAQQGLRRRAIRLHGSADETRYLDPLFMMTESGMSYADDLLMRYEHFWQQDITRAFTDCRL